MDFDKRLKTFAKIKPIGEAKVFITPKNLGTVFHPDEYCVKIDKSIPDASISFRREILVGNFSNVKLRSLNTIIGNKKFCKECLFDLSMIDSSGNVTPPSMGDDLEDIFSLTENISAYIDCSFTSAEILVQRRMYAEQDLKVFKKLPFKEASKFFVKKFNEKEIILKEALKSSLRDGSLNKRCLNFLRGVDPEEYLLLELTSDDRNVPFPQVGEALISDKKLLKNKNKFVLFSGSLASKNDIGRLAPGYQIALTFGVKDDVEFQVLPHFYFSALHLDSLSDRYNKGKLHNFVIVDEVPSKEVLETCRGLYNKDSKGLMSSYKEVLKAAKVI